MSLQKQIAECKRYEQNGLPKYLKREVAGVRRNLEYCLDKQRDENRNLKYEFSFN